MPRSPQHLSRLTLCIALGLAVPAAGLAQTRPPSRLPVTTAKVVAPHGGAATATAPVAVMVEMQETPAAIDYAAMLADTSVSKEKALAKARAVARAKVALLEPRQQQLSAALAAEPFHAAELFRVTKAMNAIAVRVDRSQIAHIKALPGVKRVREIVPEYSTNITSVPFIGAPAAWGDALGLGTSLTGAGIRIGIIDTGIDYQHPMFGGSGALADYKANDRITIHPGLFPTAKVAGGYDFAGDAYNATNTPQPDPNPMDCHGHGSHVAGTAAGFGVDGSGATFAGPYGPAAPPRSLRIGPGVAPAASLYAIRVFGCGGPTQLTVQGIEFAMDPSGKGDFSDHLDVINLSLGSTFGGLSDTSAQAAEAAALVGVVVVASQGNAGDTYYIGGSPAAAGRAVAVAAVADWGAPGAVLTVDSPPAIAGDYAAATATFGFPQTPNPSGQSGNLVLVQSATGHPGQGCDPNYTNAAAIKGNIALIQRGSCGFQLKVGNAQAAGAIAAVVFNNVPGDPALIPMGASTPTPVIIIPSLFISDDDGTRIADQGNVHVILVAASAADTLASFSSRGPRGGGSFPTRLKPDVAAPGLAIGSTQSGITCTTASNLGCITPSDSGFIPGGQLLFLQGTSQAAPHVAGTLALLRQLHPDWSVEELKALVMNGAVHDVTLGANGSGFKFGLGRVGAGRVDIPASVTSNVTAFDDDDPGLVSLAFDSAVLGNLDQVKLLRVVNHGSTAETFSLGFENLTTAPGVSFSLGDPSQTEVTVQPDRAILIPVRMRGDAGKMDHSSDPTIAPNQAAPAPFTALGNLPRHWLTEAGSYLTFSQGSQTKLRVPVYSTPLPVAAMAAASPIPTGGKGAGSSAVHLSGIGVCTGTIKSGSCDGTVPLTEASLVTPLELQVVHSLDPALPAFANLQYAGVAYDANSGNLLFGVSTWGPWASPNEIAFNIYIDSQGSGTYDKVLFNSSPGQMASSLFGTVGANGQDVFVSAILDVAAQQVSTEAFVNLIDAKGGDSRLLGNNVMVIPASPQDLGIKGTRFRYRIATCPGFDPLCSAPVDLAAGPYTFDYAAPGLDFGGNFLAFDLNGSALPVNFNVGNLLANHSRGALLLHTHNTNGTQAQVVPLEGARSADLAVTSAVSPVAIKPAPGVVVTLTLQVTNAGPNTAHGVVVLDRLPDGLTYLADDSGHAYDPSTGLWTVGQLNVGKIATVHVKATVAGSGELVNTARIAASRPLDPNPENDVSTLSLAAPRRADLAVSAMASAIGRAVTFTLHLENMGTDPSYNPRLHLSLGGASFDGAQVSTTQGSFDVTSGIWQLGSVANATTETLLLTVHARHPGAVGVSATAIASTPDPNHVNNHAAATVSVH